MAHASSRSSFIHTCVPPPLSRPVLHGASAAAAGVFIGQSRAQCPSCLHLKHAVVLLAAGDVGGLVGQLRAQWPGCPHLKHVVVEALALVGAEGGEAGGTVAAAGAGALEFDDDDAPPPLARRTIQREKGAVSMPLGTYHFFMGTSQRAPSALASSFSAYGQVR